MNLPLAFGCGLLIVLVGIALGYPLFYNRRQAYFLASAEQIKHLNERKEALYAAIQELGFDLELGKLAQADYQRLLEPLEKEAVELLRRLDQFNGHSHDQVLTERLETDVIALRKNIVPKTSIQCPACQAPRTSQDRFCSQCGSSFKDHPVT